MLNEIGNQRLAVRQLLQQEQIVKDHHARVLEMDSQIDNQDIEKAGDLQDVDFTLGEH